MFRLIIFNPAVVLAHARAVLLRGLTVPEDVKPGGVMSLVLSDDTAAPEQLFELPRFMPLVYEVNVTEIPDPEAEAAAAAAPPTKGGKK